MDYSPILNQIYSILWYLAPLFIAIAVIKTPWFKGALGEFQVNLLLKRFLPKEGYYLIKNVTLPTEDGTTQIDHILVSEYGVFVIETKNITGWIFGSFDQRQWTQKIFKHSNKFQNPIHQNYKHVKALQSCLDINLEHIHSLVVFVGDSTFKTRMPENVTYAKGCIPYIKSKKTKVLTPATKSEIIMKVEGGKLKRSVKTHRDHVAHVKGIISAKERHQEKSCPKCGSKMILRTSTKGSNAGNKFWGCSSFPKCRKIANII